jgi:hypothetical protein
MPSNKEKSSLLKTFLIAASLFLVLGVAVTLVRTLTSSGDPPIEVGDGSITFHYGGSIKMNSNNEIEVDKFLHKVKSISIGNDGIPPSSTIDVRGRAWSITSSSTPQFQLSLTSHALGLANGVAATCPSAWSGSGSDYTCTPTAGGQLTPVTITFSDGNCPGTSSSSCTLSCANAKCLLQLEYNLI